MTNHRNIEIFVATRLDDVPPGCVRYVSVDGSVPGASVTWDHHRTGELINLDAMPDEFDPTPFDGVCTTLADADAVSSAVAFLLGGKARVPAHELRVLLSASHWCDHLAPHPALDGEINRLGRGLLDAIDGEMRAGGAPTSASFAAAVRRLTAAIEAGEVLPYSDRFEVQRARAEALDRDGRIVRRGAVAVVDTRGLDGVDPLATYERHRCPVSVLVGTHPRGGPRYTVGTNPLVHERVADVTAALRALGAAEFAHGPPALSPEPVAGSENWGGRRTVFGSPWNYGSRLGVDEVVATVAAALNLSLDDATT